MPCGAYPPRRTALPSRTRIRAPIVTIVPLPDVSLPEFRPLPSSTPCWLRRLLATSAPRGYHIGPGRLNKSIALETTASSRLSLRRS